MSAKTLIVENPNQDLKNRLEKAADTKRKIKQYIQTHGTTVGLDIPGITFVKPL